ncbi:sulfite exporter TauE/SafE family protein [Halobaculum magnesiiphilum]|uniref:Probable membrane transporter protein n=1 Tax=Halobaculum magnesiiphilum TaxID=1017351 RepID=A0A8T8WJE9_9EURY|nr:sulfite exporter TauE/SafE family protein [Halobaculum magnesiiphilum]QZP39794.1 sulfite exporter TauE/SafE family protein [Halobaculum magnesiiphilum]
MTSSTTDELVETFLRYQHLFVLTAPVLFVIGVYTVAPTPADAGASYWFEYWWLLPVFMLGATIVNTVGISGSALFVPFLIFLFPLVAQPLSPSEIVLVGLVSESFGLSSSAFAFVRYGLVDRRLAVSLVVGGLPFVVGGALASFVIPETVFYALLGLALLAASYLLFNADLGHGDHADDADAEFDDGADAEAVADGGGHDLPDDDDKPGPAGVETDADGVVTRVDNDGNEYTYDRAGYLERFGNYSIGGAFQGLAGFGIGELGIISMLRTNVPVRIAIGTNHIVVAVTAVIASLVHVFGGAFVDFGHALDLANVPWNMVVFTAPAAAIGGQIAPYVSTAVDTETIKTGVGVLFAVISVALFGMATGIA